MDELQNYVGSLFLRIKNDTFIAQFFSFDL